MLFLINQFSSTDQILNREKQVYEMFRQETQKSQRNNHGGDLSYSIDTNGKFNMYNLNFNS